MDKKLIKYEIEIPVYRCKTILLLLLNLSFNLSAQEQFKYTKFENLTWDDLQHYQQDILMTSKELKLATGCPSSLKKLQNEFINKHTHMHFIHGTMYYWTEFENSAGLFCIVKHKNAGSLNEKKGLSINPNDYELLNLTQMRVLKSASLGGGKSDKERMRVERVMDLLRKSQAIQNKPYEKYGGIRNLSNYMDENTPEDSNVDKPLVDRTYIKNDGSVGWRSYTTIEFFEYKYSERQQNELIESVRKAQAFK